MGVQKICRGCGKVLATGNSSDNYAGLKNEIECGCDKTFNVFLFLLFVAFIVFILHIL
jgi:hypothetical protein